MQRYKDSGSARETKGEFYGDRLAGVEDPSGNQRWLAKRIEDVPLNEMQRRDQAQPNQAG